MSTFCNKKEEQKLGNKIFHKVWFILFLIFLTLYISQASGYYEYSISKKTTFTNEQIKRFEQDIKEGKEIDVSNYLEETKNYNNIFSSLGLKMSSLIEKGFNKTMTSLFKKLSQAVNNN